VLAVFADENVDPALLSALRARGADADRVVQRSLQGIPDSQIVALAYQERRVVLTADTDFLAIAHELQDRGEEFAPIVWWPQSKRTIGQLLSRIVPLLHEGDYAEHCSRVMYV
jgi:predicted nuclease of predicted toxin-antitoxin system